MHQGVELSAGLWSMDSLKRATPSCSTMCRRFMTSGPLSSILMFLSTSALEQRLLRINLRIRDIHGDGLDLGFTAETLTHALRLMGKGL